MRDAAIGGAERSALAGDLEGRPKGARAWSRSGSSMRASGGYTYSMRVPNGIRQRVRSRATEGEGEGTEEWPALVPV